MSARQQGATHALAWVRRLGGIALTNCERLVLFHLALCANEDGTRIFPGQTRIAEETGCGISTVRRALHKLEALKLIILVAPARVGRGASGRAAEYRLGMQHASRYRSEPPKRLQRIPVTTTAIPAGLPVTSALNTGHHDRTPSLVPPIEEDSEAAPLLREPQPGPPPDARSMIWTEGLPTLQRLTGKPAGTARGFMGMMLRELRDDCPSMLAILQDAIFARPVDPESWLLASVRSKAGSRSSGKRHALDNDIMRAILNRPGGVGHYDHG